MSIWKQIGGNRVVLALSFARMADGIGNSILFVVIPLYVSKLASPDFPLPETVRAGILISVFGIVAGIMQPFFGALVDRLNRRKPFVIGGLLLMAAATAGFTLTDRYLYTLVIRAVQGLGVAITVPASMAILTNATRRESRGGSMGIFSTFRVMSLAIGPLLGGAIHDYFGFDATFFTGAGLIVLSAVLVLYWVAEVRAATPERAHASFRMFDRRVFSGDMLALGFAVFVMATSFAMIAPLEQALNARLNEGAIAFGFAFSALMVTRILVQIPMGYISDRRGRKRLIVGGLLLMTVASAPVGLVTATWQLVGLRLLQGVASGAIAAPAFALGGDLSSAGGEGRQMSVITMGFGFGIALGTLMAGILGVVSLALPFFVEAGLTLVAAWAVHRRVRETIHAGARIEA